MMKVRPILLFGVLALCAGCRPLSLYMVQPEGPPEYKLGWEDGCDTGVGVATGGVGKMAFGFKKRPEFGDNEVYKGAWNEGFSFCRFSMDPVGKTTAYD